MEDRTMNATYVQPRSLAIHFACGFLAVLLFHQGAILILNLLGFIPNGPYRTDPIPPFGVPAFLNQAFWGGVWGLVYALVRGRIPAALPVAVAGFLFGVLGPSCFGWFVLAPLRGQPVASGFVIPNMLRSVFINGTYGLGLALIAAYAGRFMKTAEPAPLPDA
jgi:xanthosine utilization system XapX-like protein